MMDIFQIYKIRLFVSIFFCHQNTCPKSMIKQNVSLNYLKLLLYINILGFIIKKIVFRFLNYISYLNNFCIYIILYM